jgi:hypothetical protein
MTLEYIRKVLDHELEFVQDRIDALRKQIKEEHASDFDYGLFTAYSNAQAALNRVNNVLQMEEREL